MPTYDNYQPSLALTESVVTSGVFISPGSQMEGAGLGMVRTFAGAFGPDNQPLANGQTMAISQNTALFSEIGTYFGGNGQTTFGLPDLGGRTAVGFGQGPGLSLISHGEEFGSATISIGQSNLSYHSGGASLPFDNEQPSLGMHYMIQVYGVFPSQGGGSTNVGNEMIGDIALFAGNYTPDSGWVECNGQIMSIAQNQALFAIIGTTYGGDGISTFALPDLRGRTIVGAGSATDGQTYSIGEQLGSQTTTITTATTPVSMGGSGQPIDDHQPSLVMNYIISLSGIFPSRGDGGGYEDTDAQFLGEIQAFAGNFAPSGYALCQGQILSIAQNSALFALLGTTYGGNGITTFALPDLRGRDIIGTDNNHILGGVYGQNNFTMTSSGFSPLSINDGDSGNTLYGADGNDTIKGNGGNDTIQGGAGADNMYGGTGNDTFYVDNPGDMVFENTGEGTDTVLSTITYVLSMSQELENLTLLGSGNINGSGNTLNNVITGNSGDNNLAGNFGDDVLDGKGGVNYLYGDWGNDTYIVNSVNDHVSELYNGADAGGNDTVMASITYALPLYVENLILTGSAAINGSGNNLDNHITGNSANNELAGLGGNDTLDGGAGINYMYGGAGNDTYYVHTTDDHPDEQTTPGTDDGGTDTVISDITYKLGAYLENLTLAGSASINATGNNLNNVITGNSGNNILEGRVGNDTFVLGNVDNNGLDHITDFTPGSDKIEFHASDYGFTAGHILQASELSLTGAAVGTNAQFIYDTTTHTLSWDADGTGFGSAIQLVILDNGATLSTSDFLFV